MTDTSDGTRRLSRRRTIVGLAGLVLVPVLPPRTFADEGLAAEAIVSIAGGAPVRPGRVSVVMPELAENGNSVSLAISVESPMTSADHVKVIHIVADKNPFPRIASFHLGPRAGHAKIATSIRLATSQVVTAVAEMSDGTFWSGSQEVIVTLAACLDAG